MPDFVVGLTGGIGSGKSTITKLFAECGVQYVDADIVSRQLVTPGTDCYKAIVNHFGSAIVAADGNLNRPALRQRIFSNNADKLWLEQLLHPAIRASLVQQLAELTSPYGLLVAPLLLENNMQVLVNRVLVIDIEEAEQINRTVQRDNISKQQVEAIMAAQVSRKQRLQCADDVILNNGTLADLAPKVTTLHQKYLSLAQQRR